MKKFLIILFTMVLTLTSITGCLRNNTKAPTNDNNVTDNKVDNSTNGNVAAPTNETENNKNTNNTDVTVDDILNAIKTAYGENYLPNMEIDAQTLETEFGLTSDMYESVKAELPMIGTHADRVVIVKAAEGKADDVEAAFNTARENKVNDTLQYPMNLPKINATKIVRNGDFICFLMVGAINENMDATEEEAKKFAESEIEKGVNAFNELFK